MKFYGNLDVYSLFIIQDARPADTFPPSTVSTILFKILQ